MYGMKNLMSVMCVAVLGLAACSPAPETAPPSSANDKTKTAGKADGVKSLDLPEAVSVEERFATLALQCVRREYPNKISHVLTSDGDVAAPRELYPAFYGCFDWHSAVHGHWLLVRLASLNPDNAFRAPILEALLTNITAENIAGEVAYYTGEDRASFERPYGIAWYLQLVAELEETTDPDLKALRDILQPLEAEIVTKVKAWLPKLAYPIRLGTHNQSAFAFALLLDYARTVGDTELGQMLVEKSRRFHLEDVNCPIAYEPSGEDFLSPCLMEADLMRRVLSEQEFASWLGVFLPDIPVIGGDDWLEPGVVLDASDGKLVHLDGVNLSRAWALEGIAHGLPDTDPRIPALLASAELHKKTGIAAVSDEHYSGSHWLASFATYLVTQRGITGRGE